MKLFDDVIQAYQEPHRHYHNMEHVMSMFSLANHLEIALDQNQYLACWFHDVVYKIPSAPGENEEASIVVAMDAMFELDMSVKDRKDVEKLIRATAEVLLPGTPVLDQRQWQVVGLDLYSFGTPQYWLNQRHIRKEFGFLDDAAWAIGRSKFLNMMLEKQYILDRAFFFGDNKSFDAWHKVAFDQITDELVWYRGLEEANDEQ